MPAIKAGSSHGVLLLNSLKMPFGRSSLVSRDHFFDSWDIPARLRDQHFGLGLTDEDLDLASPSFYRGYYLRPRRQISSGGLSEIKSDGDKFQVRLDVGHFAPQEITVKTVDDQVVVEAKHEEKVDEHGFVSRQFSRRYMLPSGVDHERVSSSLSAEGILIVEAPKKEVLPQLAPNERPVPITVQVGSPVPKMSTSIPVHRDEKK